MAGYLGFVQFLKALGLATAAVATVLGVGVLTLSAVRELPFWARGHRCRVGLSTLGSFVVVEGGITLAEPKFSCVGPVFVPLLCVLWVRFWRRRAIETLDETSLGYFQALLGFLRAGVAVPLAVTKAGEAAPGFFSDWLRSRLSKREAFETIPQALGRVTQMGELKCESASCLQSLAEAYEKGLPVVATLERRVQWLTRRATHTRKVRGVQGALLAQAVLGGALPWVVLAFSQAAIPSETGDLWESQVWRLGLGACLAWQGVGTCLLLRLGRYG